MPKNHIFYDKYAKIKRRLFIIFLVMTFVSFGAGLGILKLSNVKIINMGLETVYEDRVKPLKQLKMISDIYAINMVDAANKVFNDIISWHEGRKCLEGARKRIPDLWDEYIHTYLVEEEKEVVDRLQLLFKAADEMAMKLNSILLNEDRRALARFIREDLYQTVDPITNKIDELYQMQIHIVKNITHTEQIRYKISSYIGIASIIISIVLCILLVLQWRRFRDLLEYL